MRKLLIASLLLSTPLMAQSLTVGPWRPSGFGPYVEADGRWLDFRNGGGGTLWAPVRQCDNGLVFAQVHGGYYRDYLTAFSFGGGYRQLMNNCWGFGANAFFDYSRSNRDFDYYQGGAGLELFGPCWVARVNGYAPGLRHVEDVQLLAIVEGNDLMVNDLVDCEDSYGGFDAEVGYGLPFCWGEVWGYATYYYFNTDQAKEIQGPRLRLELNLFDPQQLNGPQFSVGGEWSYDQFHGNQGAVTATLRLPLLPSQFCRRSSCCIKPLCRRFSAPVRREHSIWVERELFRRTEIVPIQKIFFVDSTGGGNGTQTDPMTLAAAEAASQPGNVIFGLSNTGDIAGEITMKDRQQFAGFGDGDSQTITLPDGRMVTVNKINPMGSRAIISDMGLANARLITLANDNQIFGIGFNQSTGSFAIEGMGINNTVIDDITANWQQANAVVFITNGSNASLTNMVVTAGAAPPVGSWIALQDIAGTVIFDNNTSTNTIASSTRHTFWNWSNVDVNLFARENTFIGTGAEKLFEVGLGFTGEKRALFANNTMSGAGTTAFYILNDSSTDITLENNTINGVATGVELIANLTGATDVFTALVQDNTVTQTASPFVFRNSGTFDNGTGFSNLTWRDNKTTGTTGTVFTLASGSTMSQTVCHTVLGNSATTMGTVLNVPNPIGAGTVSIYPSNMEADIRTNNTFPAGSTITIGNMVQAAPVPCPLPLLP